MARHFQVDKNGVVTSNHTATAGVTYIELSGNTGKTFYAFFGSPPQNQTQNLLGVDSIQENEKRQVQPGAQLGRWQLGTDAANNGGTGQGHGPPVTSNGQLNVGSGGGDEEDEEDKEADVGDEPVRP